MAKQIVNNGDYAFDASAQTVTLTAIYNGIGIENILLITNLVTNQIIYQFTDAALGGTIAGANVITLTYNTTAMADSDELMIIIEWSDIIESVNIANSLNAEISNDSGNPIPIVGTVSTGLNQPLTDGQLRASAVAVTGTVSVVGGGDASAANQASEIALLTTIDADTSNISTKINTVAGAVSGSEMQVDVVTMPSITGTVTANAGTNLNTSALAVESGGNLAAIATSTAIIDDWDESDRAKVNIIAGQAGVAAGAGNDSNTTQRVIEASANTVYNGKTTVTTAGTRVVLAASTTIKSVTVKALASNTGLIYVGNNTVASTNGFQLSAGDAISLDFDNLNTINIDSQTNGEGVTYLAIN